MIDDLFGDKKGPSSTREEHRIPVTFRRRALPSEAYVQIREPLSGNAFNH
jgi:hypothetical protein